MRINEDEIKNVARLARLNLKDDEISSMAKQLDQILAYVQKLNEVDTTGIKATSHAIDSVNAFRPDQLQESLPREKALANSAKHNDEAFVVPRVI